MSVTLRPTDLLREDHKMVLGKLNDLEEVIGKLDDPDAITSPLKELASFFKGEIWVHFSKEEEVLFPELEKFIPREGGPTGVMLLEHEDLRKTNEGFQEGVSGYLETPDNAEAVALVRENARHIIDVLRAHIDKEDNILFMMAEMHLDDPQNERIIRAFEEIEKKFQ